jgi:hypothetical protein
MSVIELVLLILLIPVLIGAVAVSPLFWFVVAILLILLIVPRIQRR